MAKSEAFTGWGFVNLAKPIGWTSHDCIGKLRRLLGIRKIGHGGTLDPMATGVLPIAVGRATRLLQYLPKHKIYEGVIRFGQTTTTDDIEGSILSQAACPGLQLNDIKLLLPQFIGSITQTPPAFSAIQRDGKRLYELARQGIPIDVPQRQVEVSRLDVLHWQPGAFPELTVRIKCGEGTYIRAIARDLGVALGVGGTLSALTRTLSGGFEISSSTTLDAIAAQRDDNSFACLGPEEVLKHLPRISLNSDQARQWSYGQKIRWERDKNGQIESPLAVYDEVGSCVGVGELRSPSPEEAENMDLGLILAGKVVLTGR